MASTVYGDSNIEGDTTYKERETNIISTLVVQQCSLPNKQVTIRGSQLDYNSIINWQSLQ